MSDIERKSREAKEFLENPVFNEIIGEIEAEARLLFFNPTSDIESLTAAHAKIKAIAVFKAAIQRRIDDYKVKLKKQDRQ